MLPIYIHFLFVIKQIHQFTRMHVENGDEKKKKNGIKYVRYMHDMEK